MSAAEPEPRSQGIQVIARAAHILRVLKESSGGMSQAELASALGLPRTTIFRILSALEDEELVALSATQRGRYRLGPEIVRLASAAARDLVGLLHPLLVELSGEMTETVDLSLLEAGQVLFVDQVDAPHRLRAASAVGESFPVHSCAPGKAMLSVLSPSRRADLLPSRLVASTSRTITDPAALTEELEEVRRTGIAFDYEEQNEGICAAGTAFEVAGTLLAVSIPVPAQRFEGRERECAAALLEFRQRVESQDWS